jgi:serine/threonine-protein kinase PRP4
VTGINSPTASGSGTHDGSLSPAALDIANDQDLINKHVEAKVMDEDGPSAADYDPTADMKEDERRDEMRHGHVGLHGQDRHPSQAEIAVPSIEEPPKKQTEDDDDEFDMFADDFDDEKFAPPEPATKKPTAIQDGGEVAELAQPTGGGILEGDDKDGYYKIRPGEVLGGRYQVQSALGKGMFSGVARAMDVTTKELVAIKMMRNNDALRKGGFTEIAILEKLNAADAENKKHIVKFERWFEYKGHLCMAFENLSLNLREVLKKFGNNIGININATRAYAYQIFVALAHMRKCTIIHADLKPDNILVSPQSWILVTPVPTLD